jgi:metallo-beta-lactamase family protein
MANITFYGGVGTVTGSKYLLESNGKKVLVDCGLFQGLKELRERNWQTPQFDPAEIDAVIITHAHIDHTGYLPRLVKLGFRGKVFTSSATCDLLKVLLPDSGRLQQEDADYRNRHNLTSHAPALPLYDENDANNTLDLLEGVPNDGEAREICDGFKASFYGCRTYYRREPGFSRNGKCSRVRQKRQIPVFRRFRTLRPADSERPGVAAGV